jgi:hypothetical protein
MHRSHVKISIGLCIKPEKSPKIHDSHEFEIMLSCFSKDLLDISRDQLMQIACTIFHLI